MEQKYRLQACSIDLETMLAIVAPYYEIESDNLKSGGKECTITRARTLLCYLAVCKLMISCADVARALHVGPTTLSRAASRGPQLSNLEQIQKKLLAH